MVAVTFMWSIAGVVTRHLEQARSFEITFWRSFFTTVSLLVILPIWRGGGMWRTLPWRSRVFWLSGVCWAVMFTAFMVALTLTSVANVLLTMSVGPLLTALFSRVFLGHRLALRTWVAIGVAGFGIAYMQASQAVVNPGGAGWIGFAVAVCVPVAGALQWTLMQHSQRRKPLQLDASPAPALDLVPCVLVGAVLSSLVTLPLAFPFQATGHDVALLALLGLVQLAVPCVLSVLCATVLKAPELSLLQLLEVIFGILLVWVGVGEAPSASVLAGGVLVIGALVANEVLAWRQRSE
jgi:drug/metabolite transporter (DMT)-like permease